MEDGNYNAFDLAKLALSIRERHKQTPVQIYAAVKKDYTKRWVTILSQDPLPERTQIWIPGKKEDEILYREMLVKDGFRIDGPCSFPSDKMLIFLVKTPGTSDDAFFKKSESTTLLLNADTGAARKMYLATVSVNQNDVCKLSDCPDLTSEVCCAPKVTITADDGTSHVAQFFVDHPKIITSRVLEAWIPAASWQIRNTAMLSDYPLNTSATIDPSYRSSPNTDVSGNPIYIGAGSVSASKRSAPISRPKPMLAAGLAPNLLANDDMHLMSNFETPGRKLLGIKDIGATAATRRWSVFASLGMDIAEAQICRIGNAIDGGFGSFLNNLWGCSVNVQDAINKLNRDVIDLKNFADWTHKQLDQQNQWNIDVDSQLQNIVSADFSMAQSISTMSRDVNYNFQLIQGLQNVTTHLANSIDTGFKMTDSAIAALDAGEQRLGWLISNTSSGLQTQITRLVQLADAADNMIKSTQIDLYQMYRKPQTRRSLISSFWISLADSTRIPLPTCPFVQCTGSQPMPITGSRDTTSIRDYCYSSGAVGCPADTASRPTDPTKDTRVAQSSINQATVIARTRLLYTLSENGGRTAYERVVEYRCDPLFLLQTSIPAVDFRTLFRFVGPPPNATGGTCYPSYNGDAQWNCNCVIVQRFAKCALKPGGQSFPWGWTQTKSLKYASTSDITDNCDSGGVQEYSTIYPDPFMTIGSMLDTYGSIFTDLVSWTNFLTAFCSASNFVTDGNGNRIRVTSDTFNSFSDLTLLNLNGTLACESDPMQIMALSDNKYRLSYNIYQFWSYGYQISASYVFPKLERMYFGSPPTDAKFETSPFGIRPDVADVMDTTTMTYMKVAADGIPAALTTHTTHPAANSRKIPVYSVQTIDMVHTAMMVIDYNAQNAVNINLTSTIGLNCDQVTSLNKICSYMDLQLNEEYKQVSSILNDIYLVGDFDLSGAPIYDIPQALLPASGSAGARCGSLMYMAQPRNTSSEIMARNGFDNDWTVPINAKDWVYDNGVQFDPTCMPDSAHLYLKQRVGEDAYGSRWKCGNNLDALYADMGERRVENEFCRLLNFYRLEKITDRTVATAAWIPYEWTEDITFQVPQGQWKQTIRSSCPINYEITKDGVSDTQVTFYTNSTSRVDINVVWTTYVDNTKPPCGSVPPTFTSCWYSKTHPCVVNLPQCGTQYVNVATLDTDLRCYPDPGLEMWTAHSGIDPPVVPSPVETRITQMQDQVVANIGTMFQTISLIQAELAELSSKAVSPDVLQATVDQIIKQTHDAISSLSWSSETSNSQYAANTMANMQQYIDQEIADVNARYDEQQKLLELLLKMNSTQLIIDRQTLLINQTTQGLDAAWKKLDDEFSVEFVKDGATCGGSGLFSLITSIGCGIRNFIDGVGNFFANLMQILLWIIVFVVIPIVLCCLFCECCKPMSKICCSCIKSTREWSRDDEDEHETRALKKSHTESNPSKTAKKSTEATGTSGNMRDFSGTDEEDEDDNS